MRYFTLAFLIVSLSGFSQAISKQVIGPGGGVFENDTHKFSYTAGEVVVGAMTSDDGSIQLGNGYYPSLDLSTLNTVIQFNSRLTNHQTISGFGGSFTALSWGAKHLKVSPSHCLDSKVPKYLRLHRQ